MKKFILLIWRNKRVYRVIIFMMTIFVVVSLFPRGSKFRYEYQKGSPWKHENLIAPYKFTIYKLSKELENERDTLRKNAKPYYTLDDSISIRELSRLKKRYEYKWETYQNLLNFNPNDKNLPRYNKFLLNKYIGIVLNTLDFIYSTGIISYDDVFKNVDNKKISIFIVRDKVAEEFDYDEVFTLKNAYQYVMKELHSAEPKYLTQKTFEMSFIEDLLSAKDFLKPNLIYDKLNSEANMNAAVSEVTETRGEVQAGERIIFKGEVVDENKFRILESYRKQYEKTYEDKEKDKTVYANYYVILFGQSVLVTVSFLVLFLFLSNFRKNILRDNLKVTFLLMLITLVILIANLVINFNIVNVYVLPFALVPMIIRTFYDSRLALFIHIIICLLLGFWVPNSFEFVFIQFIVGMVSIFALAKLYRRSQLFFTSGAVVFTYCITYLGILIIQIGNVREIEWRNFGWFIVNGLLLLTAYPLIYVFERIFGFLSDVTLLELSDSNQPLLRKMAEEVPGTFQHSMQVANLAEEAIFQIGGSTLLVRTGAMYHDVGKMAIPLYFIENQSGINAHDGLDFDKSAEIIISHVTNGVEIAKKYRLPQQVIDFIVTHHGRSRANYFYRSFINKYPDKVVDIARFTYPGPPPFSKETAVLMMADAVEAASRSLKVKTEETINKIVDDIINSQMSEGFFDDAPITFKEIAIVKSVFKKKLKNIYHARIEYPK